MTFQSIMTITKRKNFRWLVILLWTWPRCVQTIYEWSVSTVAWTWRTTYGRQPNWPDHTTEPGADQTTHQLGRHTSVRSDRGSTRSRRPVGERGQSYPWDRVGGLVQPTGRSLCMRPGTRRSAIDPRRRLRRRRRRPSTIERMNGRFCFSNDKRRYSSCSSSATAGQASLRATKACYIIQPFVVVQLTSLKRSRETLPISRQTDALGGLLWTRHQSSTRRLHRVAVVCRFLMGKMFEKGVAFLKVVTVCVHD